MLVRPESNSRPPARQPYAQPTEPPIAVNHAEYSTGFYLFYFILLASPIGRVTATACANYCGPGTRSQFCGGRKPECPEKTLEVRLRLTQTQSTYNIVVEVEDVIDVHYASLTSQGVQHRVFCLDGHPSRYQPHPTGLNFGEQTGTGVFPLVIAVPPCNN